MSEYLDDDMIVCRCEEVTVGEIRAAVRDGAKDVVGVKRRTREFNEQYVTERSTSIRGYVLRYAPLCTRTEHSLLAVVTLLTGRRKDHIQ